MAVGHLDPSPMPAVAGFRMATTGAAVKGVNPEEAERREDMLLVEMAPGTTVAGVFTQNRVVAAPVTLCRQRLAGGEARALLVNSGNANACTGPRGMADAKVLCRDVASGLNVAEESVFISSTGVIGEPLPMDRMQSAIPTLVGSLTEEGSWWGPARAIMTTDTFPKAVQREISLGGETVRLVGIAKGSGMIHPDMATMLAYLFTDAKVSAPVLQEMLKRAVALSFNSITVDGDTSTNDTLMAFASGQADHDPIDSISAAHADMLQTAVNDLCRELAQWLIRDGEGADKYVTIRVNGTRCDADAHQVALAVAKSPLVKTAFAGSDANWGRIIAAVGYAGVKLDPDAITMHLGDVLIVEKGARAASYTEEAGQAVMDRPEIDITIDLAQGSGTATVWTTDLGHEYVTINADYRT